MSFIGIDLGATFLKGAWLHPEKGVLSAIHREPFPDFLSGLPAGHREVSSVAVLDAVKRLIERLFAENIGCCEGLLICGQMHGLVLVNSESIIAGNFISWQDARCRETAKCGISYFEVAQQRLTSALCTELGNEFRPGLPVTTLYTLASRGELPPGVVPLSLMDFVAARLTGATPVTHPTNAAAYGLFDVARGAWHGEALERLGLDRILLPPSQAANVPVGNYRFGGRKFPVYTPIGDQQAALLGTGLQPGELSINVATGSQVSILVDSPLAGDWQLRPYFDGLWLRTVTHLPAGRALNRLVDLCGELAADQGTALRDPWGQISRLIEASIPHSLTLDLSFFPSAYGEEGSLTHILEDEITVGCLFRAALRAMAENYARSAIRVSPSGWSRIVFSGGLVQKLPALRGEILTRLGHEHRSAPHEEDTLMGLLILAREISENR